VECAQLHAVLDDAADLEHVDYLLRETLFSTWMLNTMIIALASTAISLFCGLLAGYALSGSSFRSPAASAPASS